MHPRGNVLEVIQHGGRDPSFSLSLILEEVVPLWQMHKEIFV
jgi:hypothetical protein